jgi:hypothetical protein
MYLVTQTSASISSSEAEYARSAELSCLLAKAIARSVSLCTYDKMVPTATFEASVMSMNGSLKFG